MEKRRIIGLSSFISLSLGGIALVQGNGFSLHWGLVTKPSSQFFIVAIISESFWDSRSFTRLSSCRPNSGMQDVLASRETILEEKGDNDSASHHGLGHPIVEDLADSLSPRDTGEMNVALQTVL